MRPRAGIRTTPDTRAPPSPPRGPPIAPLPILRPTKSTPPPPPPSGSAPRNMPDHSGNDAPVPQATPAAPAEVPESPPPSRTHPAPSPRTPPPPPSHAREAPPRSRPQASPGASRRTRLRCVLGTCAIRPSPQPCVAGRRSSRSADAKHDADVRAPVSGTPPRFGASRFQALYSHLPPRRRPTPAGPASGRGIEKRCSR